MSQSKRKNKSKTNLIKNIRVMMLDRIMIETIFLSGMRISEVINIPKDYFGDQNGHKNQTDRDNPSTKF